MLSDDELGDALRRELAHLGGDLHPSASLLAHLEAIPDRRRPRRPSWLRSPRPQRWLAVPAALVTAVLVVVVVFVLAGTDPSRALAITIISHGKEVQVSIQDLEAVSPGNAKLKVLGHVRVVPMTARCRTPTSEFNYMGIAEHPAPRIEYGSPPASYTEIIAAKRIGPNHIDLAIGSVTGKVPTCLSSKGIGPGLAGWHLTAKNRIRP